MGISDANNQRTKSQKDKLPKILGNEPALNFAIKIQGLHRDADQFVMLLFDQIEAFY